ncbi:hypothetical protein EVAR_94355_1 [Eumeta japonica]|uniref:Uncharacterized protein n=1 Tax=Eumeta variegata TaxID=151549 RepID=A0A4C1TPV8_EUMVA|nr:hypothetical protein EVAR_94355_1 [Eumeta japonica]
MIDRAPLGLATEHAQNPKIHNYSDTRMKVIEGAVSVDAQTLCVDRRVLRMRRRSSGWDVRFWTRRYRVRTLATDEFSDEVLSQTKRHRRASDSTSDARSAMHCQRLL